MEHLCDEERRTELADPRQLRERCDLRPVREYRGRIEQCIATIGFYGLDLIEDEMEPFELACDLCLEVASERTAITCAQKYPGARAIRHPRGP